MTPAWGCPYWLLRPALMIPTSGRTSDRKASDVEVFEPWCPTLRTSMSESSPDTIMSASDETVASPVKRTSTVPPVSETTIEFTFLSVANDDG